MTEHVCRRTVLRGAAAAAGSCLLAACGGSDDGEPSAQTPQESTPTSSTPSPTETNGNGGGEVIAALDDIPVGEAISAKAGDSPILLVRTSETEVTGFSAVCTHMQCTVAPGKEALVCPCHGSTYTSSGQVQQGPATRALRQFTTAFTNNVLTITV